MQLPDSATLQRITNQCLHTFRVALQLYNVGAYFLPTRADWLHVAPLRSGIYRVSFYDIRNTEVRIFPILPEQILFYEREATEYQTLCLPEPYDEILDHHQFHSLRIRRQEARYIRHDAFVANDADILVLLHQIVALAILKMVDPDGYDPSIAACKAAGFPISLRAHLSVAAHIHTLCAKSYMVDSKRFELSASVVRKQRSPK